MRADQGRSGHVESRRNGEPLVIGRVFFFYFVHVQEVYRGLHGWHRITIKPSADGYFMAPWLTTNLGRIESAIAMLTISMMLLPSVLRQHPSAYFLSVVFCPLVLVPCYCPLPLASTTLADTKTALAERIAARSGANLESYRRCALMRSRTV